MKLFILIFFYTFHLINGYLTNVCYDDYGCFSISYPFFDAYTRPLTLLPQQPDRIATKFYLYTRSNPNGVQIDAQNSSEFFHSNTMTRFIVHGFLHNSKKAWVIEMKNALLENSDENVITVDWSKGNFFPYTQATANTRIVGVEIAKLVNSYISKELITVDNVHIIGHSLGSHIAGYAGERIPSKIARISALDPAGPLFENTDPRVRLDPTDAKFVDVIHSDATTVSSLIVGYGLIQKVGHVDFYPNGGLNQPNCPITTNKVLSTMTNAMSIEMREIEDIVACSHISAAYFFTDSILNSKCQFTAYPCKHMNQFKTGSCMTCSSNGCNRMGFHASPSNDLGDLYLTTQSADRAPYCLQHYKVTLESADFGTKKQTSGKFSISLIGSLRNSESFVIDDSKTTFKEGLVINRLIDMKTPIGDIKGASVSFTKPYCYFFTCWYNVDSWNFDKIKIVIGETQKTIELCSKSAIASGSQVEFIPC